MKVPLVGELAVAVAAVAAAAAGLAGGL